MDDLQEKLSAVLNDPQAMQKIMSLAGQLGQQEQKEQREEPAVPALGGFDPAMLQRISQMAAQGSIDKNQQGLLRALGPYLSAGRIAKLERAMRAARMAGMATGFMSRGR